MALLAQTGFRNASASVTVEAGTDRVAICGFGFEDTADPGALAMTLGGQTLTYLGRAISQLNGGYYSFVYLYYADDTLLTTIGTGAKTLAKPTGAHTQGDACFIAQFSGREQAEPTFTLTGSTTSGTAATGTVAAAAGADLFAIASYNFGTGTPTVGGDLSSVGFDETADSDASNTSGYAENVAAGTKTATINFGYSTSRWALGSVAVDPAPSGPTVTDVNTDEALSPGESITITGTGFGASQGAGGVAITQEAGAVSSAVTVTGWADTSITGTVALGGLSYGATTSLVVTDNAAATGNISVTFVPATGYSYVTLSGYPHATAYVVGDGASPALVDGDQVEYESTASSGAGVTVNADGSFVLDTTDPGHFQYRVRDDTDNTWSDWATIYVNEAAPSDLVGAAPTRWWLQTPKRKRKYAGRLM